MDSQKVISVLETTRLMFEMSLNDSDCDKDSAEAREDNEETIEAINEAIKALKRKPCNDVISRKEALKEMQKYHDDCAKTSEYTRLGFETAMNVVKELPPVPPERPKGKWIEITNQRGTVVALRCSNCEKSPKHAIKSDFCPHCGADMRG